VRNSRPPSRTSVFLAVLLALAQISLIRESCARFVDSFRKASFGSPNHLYLERGLMRPAPKDEIATELQRKYYAATAQEYDALHVCEDHEHAIALRFLMAAAGHFDLRSVLDVGSGTGRALLTLKSELPRVIAVGIEPSPEMRKVGHSKGLSETELIDGDVLNLKFPDNSFDAVCEFGILHHVPDPARAIEEMMRVARKAIFISDSNNFGQGGQIARFLKQTIHAFGLWHIVDLLKTRGKGYYVSEADGLAYSFSVFSHLKQVSRQCKSIYLLNTKGAGPNLYRSATHIALLGVKIAEQ
jgi:ubiquinone/menaquinone biosynthesis C-methylase UbiE